MSAHTPGPWHTVGPVGAATWIKSDTRPNIAAVHGAATEVGQANARLIAAAPELLDALGHMQWCRSCSEGSWAACDGGRAALAAIEKAEGRGR